MDTKNKVVPEHSFGCNAYYYVVPGFGKMSYDEYYYGYLKLKKFIDHQVNLKNAK